MHTRKASYSPGPAGNEAPRVSSKRRRLNQPRMVTAHSEEHLDEEPANVNKTEYKKQHNSLHGPEKTDCEGADRHAGPLGEGPSSELIEQLLCQAEENLAAGNAAAQPSSSARYDGGLVPKLGDTVVSERHKQLTKCQHQNSLISSTDGTVKQMSAPLSQRQKAKMKDSTAGDKWFDMPATQVTASLKQDLMLLQVRDVLDPKRHYRSSAKAIPKYFQMGTIVESPSEYFSARIKNKDRRETIMQELLADQKSREYFKKKYNEIQVKSTSGGRKWYQNMQKRRNRR